MNGYAQQVCEENVKTQSLSLEMFTKCIYIMFLRNTNCDYKNDPELAEKILKFSFCSLNCVLRAVDVETSIILAAFI